MLPDPCGAIYCADGVEVARCLSSESVDLVYLDPPFNTGKQQARERLQTTRVKDGAGIEPDLVDIATEQSALDRAPSMMSSTITLASSSRS